MGEAGCKVILVAYERALAEGCPVVGLWHSGGARLREGVVSLHAVGEVFAIMTRASGKVPQISVVLGPAAGGAAYGPALTDVVILGPEGRVFVDRPRRRALGDRRGRRRAAPRRPRAARAPLGRRARRRRDPGGRLRRGPPARGAARRPARARRARGPRPGRVPARVAQAGLRRAPDRRAPARRRLGARAAPQVGAERHDDPRPPRRPHRRRHRQQPAAPRRLPGLGVGGEGGAVRADVRRVRRAARGRGRRARLPPGRRAGVGRRRAARRQAAARLRRVRPCRA